MKVYVVPENDSLDAKAKAWFKNRCVDVKDWYEENKVLVWLFGPTVIGAIGGIAKAVLKHKNINAAEDLKTLFVWDAHIGHYWQLRRKLTSAEWLSVESRVKAGESMGKVLSELRVLK